jgi:hypothetical protein
MSDSNKQDIPDALDKVKGKPREQHGMPKDGRALRHGDVDQADSGAKNPQLSTTDTKDAEAAVGNRRRESWMTHNMLLLET